MGASIVVLGSTSGRPVESITIGPVPEPSLAVLLGLGVGLAATLRKRRS